jgi:hypothetical protein
VTAIAGAGDLVAKLRLSSGTISSFFEARDVDQAPGKVA